MIQLYSQLSHRSPPSSCRLLAQLVPNNCGCSIFCMLACVWFCSLYLSSSITLCTVYWSAFMLKPSLGLATKPHRPICWFSQHQLVVSSSRHSFACRCYPHNDLVSRCQLELSQHTQKQQPLNQPRHSQERQRRTDALYNSIFSVSLLAIVAENLGYCTFCRCQSLSFQSSCQLAKHVNKVIEKGGVAVLVSAWTQSTCPWIKRSNN